MLLPTANGQGCGCRRRQSGRRRQEAPTGGNFRGATNGMPASATPGSQVRGERRQWAVMQMVQVPTGFRTWRGTCGSGARIGMMRTTTRARRIGIRRDQIQGNTGCCGAARGTTMFAIAALPSAALLRPPSGSIIMVFVASKAVDFLPFDSFGVLPFGR